MRQAHYLPCPVSRLSWSCMFLKFFCAVQMQGSGHHTDATWSHGLRLSIFRCLMYSKLHAKLSQQVILPERKVHSLPGFLGIHSAMKRQHVCWPVTKILWMQISCLAGSTANQTTCSSRSRPFHTCE